MASHANQVEWVKWKDLLHGDWRGPDPVLIRARGSVCVFPQDEQDPVWVPERLTRKTHHGGPPDEVNPIDGADTDKSGATMGDTVGVPDPDARVI